MGDWNDNATEQEVIWPLTVQASSTLPVYYARALFSLAECAKLRKAGEMERRLYMVENDSSADVDSYVLDDTTKWGWVYTRVEEAALRMNAYLGIAVSGFTEPLKVQRYGPGQHVSWHSDYIGTDVSKLSFVAEIGPLAYTGGGLKLLNVPTLPLLQGDGIVFPSYMVHEAAKVYDGERWSLTGWIAGPAYR